MNLADGNFDDFHAQNSTFSSFAVYNERVSSLSGGSQPVRVNWAEVSSGFFQALGVEPFRGRAFAPDEQRFHGSPAAIVSDGYWRRYLGAASDLSGIQLRTEGGVYPVIGVMPQGFDFPAGVSIWVPRELAAESIGRTAHNWRGLGRLRD